MNSSSIKTGIKTNIDSIKTQDTDKKAYIVSEKNSISFTIQDELSRNNFSSEIIDINQALEKDLSDMTGLFLIADSSASKNSSFENNNPKNSKNFLRKAFLLAKKSGSHLMKSSCSFFVSISFLGGTFGFGDEYESIFDPIQGGLAGLIKTAAIEWKSVLCKGIDIPSRYYKNLVKKAVNLIIFQLNYINSTHSDYKTLTYTNAAYTNSSLYDLYNSTEIGIKDDSYIIPKLIEKPLNVDSSFDQYLPNVKDYKNGEEQRYNNISNKDVFVITGGAKGVTAECAAALAKRFAPVIILIGRSGLSDFEPLWLNGIESESDIKKEVLNYITKNSIENDHFLQNFKIQNPDSLNKKVPTPMELQTICKKILANREVKQNLERIRNAGSIVEYYSTDIRNMSEVEEAFKDIGGKFGKISGIVHGAGILEDKLIIDKTESQFSSVFDTKVDGMENLIKASLQDDLKYVVFFSSVAARSGNLGQVDYSMANEVLNKTAQFYAKFNTKNNCRFLSINWGPWEGGMVTPSLRNAFIKRGIDLIPLKSGAESFVQELVENSSDIEVVIGASLLQETKDGYNQIIKHQNVQYSKNNTNKLSEPLKPDEITQIKSLKPLFNKEQILAFSIGRPSEGFGDKYKEFDSEREIARLPGPPYLFMDRIIKIDAEQWEMKQGGWIEAQFDMPCNEWYFRAAHSDYLPFCILLEIALQPCGWLAAYAGSALKSRERLYFRNLGGEAEVYKPLKRPCINKTNNISSNFTAAVMNNDINNTTIASAAYSYSDSADNNLFITLNMRARMTSVSNAGGLIIQNFDMEVLKGDEYIYKGKTNFGFFTAQSLSNQKGIKNSHLEYEYKDKLNSNISEHKFYFQDHHPITPDDLIEDKDLNITKGMPAKSLRMFDCIDIFSTNGGKYDKGFIKGSKKVNADEWFFKAHFYQDPVCPGSLGVESFLQIIKVYAIKSWNYDLSKYDLISAQEHTHKWIYRGQILPSCKKIEISAHIKENIDNHKITADGLLYVDGLCIYQMEDFSLELAAK